MEGVEELGQVLNVLQLNTAAGGAGSTNGASDSGRQQQQQQPLNQGEVLSVQQLLLLQRMLWRMLLLQGL